MTAYRCLIGPVAFAGGRIYEICHIDESGRVVLGIGATVVDAQSDVDSRTDGGVWVASGDLIAALGLPLAMQGAPNHHQLDAALAQAMASHDPGRLWAFQNLPRFGAACHAFARLASLTDGYPEGQSFPFQALFDGDFTITLWGALSFGGNRIAASLFHSKADLRACYDAAMGGETEAAMIDTSVVVLDLAGPWICRLTKDLLGHGFAPQVFQRRNGVQEAAHESTVNLLAAVAMAAPAQPRLEKQGSGAFCADDLRISCDLRLMDI